jgi:hypothetical protein
MISNPGVTKRFKVDMAGMTDPDDHDQEIRLRALRRGFVRLNYIPNNGLLVVEGNVRFWNVKVKDAVWSFVAENAGQIDNITVHVLDDDGHVSRQGSAQLFRYDDKEKLEHLPLISESLRRAGVKDVSEAVNRYFGRTHESMVEVLPAREYYKHTLNNPAPGWVVLVNGQPHHVGTTGAAGKKEAEDIAKRFGWKGAKA